MWDRVALLCKPEFPKLKILFFINSQKPTTLQQVTGGKILNLVLKKMLELFLKTQENIRILIYKKENFKPDFKPMIENLLYSLYQLENKQAKCAKLHANIRLELESENAPKLFSKYLKDRICKIKQYLNYIYWWYKSK